MPKLFLYVVCVPFLIFSSCSNFAGKLLMMEANFYHSRGQTNDAIASYLKAAAYPDAKPYAEFGLGVMYYSLDQKDAALERLTEARNEIRNRADHKELLYRIYYNSGIIHFENGLYHEAATDFRAALGVESSHVEAKRNLELSLLSQSHDENASNMSVGEEEKQENTRTEALFDYLRQKESKQWKSREWIEDVPASGLDY